MAIDVCVVLAPIFSLLTYKCDITLEDFAICGSCKCLEHEFCHILVFHTLGYNSAGRPITEVPPIKTWSRGHFEGQGILNCPFCMTAISTHHLSLYH